MGKESKHIILVEGNKKNNSSSKQKENEESLHNHLLGNPLENTNLGHFPLMPTEKKKQLCKVGTLHKVE